MQTPEPPADALNAQRIRQLLAQLGRMVPLVVLAVVLLVAAGFYFLQVRPLAAAGALQRQQEATGRVVAKIESLSGQVERVLLTTAQWSRDGLANIDDMAAFNRLLIPVLQQRGIVSSVHLADDSGRELLLMKTASGWKNRVTDVAKQPGRQHFFPGRMRARLPVTNGLRLITTRAPGRGSPARWQLPKIRCIGPHPIFFSQPRSRALPSLCAGRMPPADGSL